MLHLLITYIVQFTVYSTACFTWPLQWVPLMSSASVRNWSTRPDTWRSITTHSRAPGTPTSSVLETVTVLLHQKQPQLWVCIVFIQAIIKIQVLIFVKMIMYCEYSVVYRFKSYVLTVYYRSYIQDDKFFSIIVIS